MTLVHKVYIIIFILLTSLTISTVTFHIKNYMDSLIARDLEFKINHIIMRARAIAVYENTNIDICPSINGISCNSIWLAANHILIVTMETKTVRKIYSIKANMLYFHGFGNSSYITVLRSGDTHQNGHFAIYDRATSNLKYKIVINKAGKTYTQNI